MATILRSTSTQKASSNTAKKIVSAAKARTARKAIKSKIGVKKSSGHHRVHRSKGSGRFVATYSESGDPREQSAMIRVVVLVPHSGLEISVSGTDPEKLARVVKHLQSDATGIDNVETKVSGPATNRGPAIVFAGTYSSPLRAEKSGRLHAGKIAAAFGVTTSAIARLLGVSPAAVSQTADSENYQGTLARFESAYRILPLLKNEDAFRGWLQTANAEIDGKTPQDLLFSDDYPQLITQLESVLSGEPL